MKKHFGLVLMVAVIGLGTSAARAAEIDLNCVNIGYRDAALVVNSDALSIKDSTGGESPSLAKLLEDRYNLKSLFLNNIRLTVWKGGKSTWNCDATVPFLLNCDGSAEIASLEVQGNYSERSSGPGSSITLSLPVIVKYISLATHLSSDGPVTLGPNSTTVSLNEMGVDAQADISLDGKDFHLKWTPFFYTTDDPTSFSYCR